MSQAQNVLESAVKNQPKKRGCFRGCLIAVLVLAVPVWWFCLHTTPLRVSKETTYVLGPMTSDGKRIDYFLAMEERYYPPEMKTDENGYRLIVRAIGDMVKRTKHQVSRNPGEHLPALELDPEPYRLQVYEKLGLDPNEKPTLKKIESVYTFLAQQYDEVLPPIDPPVEGAPSMGMGGAADWSHKYGQWKGHWTFDDFPMLEDWLEENTAGLDLLGEAMRKPAFRVPSTRENENTPIFEAWLHLGEVQMMREWSRALQARANYRLGIGDIDGAIYDIVTIHRLGRHAGKQGMLISALVGIAIEGMGYSIGIGSNPEFPPTKEQLEQLVAELDALPPRYTFNETFESERLFGLAAYQDMYWGDHLDSYNFGIAPKRLFSLMSWTLDINIVLTRANEMYDAMTIPGATIDGKTLDEFVASPPKPSWNPVTYLSAHSRSTQFANSQASLFMPAIQASRAAWRRLECIESMQRLTLALLLYEKEHGKLPEGDWREAIRPYLAGIPAHENRNAGVPAKWFQCPSCPGLAENETTYAMIRRESGETPTTPNTLLLVEVHPPMKIGEGDGTVSEAVAKMGINRKHANNAFVDGLSSYHSGGASMGFRSGAVRFTGEKIEPDELQKLLDGTATELP